MNNDSEFDIIKSGELYAAIRLTRGKNGVLINVKIHPSVEETIKSWGDGSKVAISNFGRDWRPVAKDAVLQVYQANELPERLILEGGKYYIIDAPGRPILIEEPIPGNPRADPTIIFNFSMVRLVGASNDGGVTFQINGLMSLERLKRIKDGLQAAARRFYFDYMKPVDLTVNLIGDPRVDQQQVIVPVPPLRREI